jgi:hypothetical protein
MQLTLNFWNSTNFFMIWIIYLLELNSFDITYPIQMGCVCACSLNFEKKNKGIRQLNKYL